MEPAVTSQPRATYVTSSFNASDYPPPSYRSSVPDKSSLDITQHIERKLAQYNASQNVFKRWLFEIISITTSAVCMGAIIGILATIKNEPLVKKSFGLTMITVLSKVASAALILPISEAIGQLKWSWFYGKQSKDAFDFEIFDKASRGAWGSILLLIRTKGRSLAALGAILTVLLLAIDTFFQQVTDLPERWTPRGVGLIARVDRYDPEVVYAWQSSAPDAALAQPNQDLLAALVPLYYDQNGTQHSKVRNGSDADFPISCPTSLCKWDTYETLGVCSACADISNLLTWACLPMKLDWIRNSTGPKYTEHTWPNGTACGYFLNATSSRPVLLSGYRMDLNQNSTPGETLLMRTLPLITNPERHSLHDGSINFKHITRPILDTLIVSSADGTAESVYRKELPIAHECILAWCAKRIHSSYSWGVYEEFVEEIHFNTSKTPYPWMTSYDPATDLTDHNYYGNLSIYTPNTRRNGPGFGVSNETMLDTVFAFDQVFPSVITIMNPGAKPFLKVRTSFTDRVMFRAFRFNPFLAPNNITHHMARIANAITSVARSDASSNNFIEGQAYAPEVYIQVNWGWLSFPLAMLALCIVFLTATIMKTSTGGHEELGTWKTSAMPTLIYSLPQQMRHNLVPSSLGASTSSKGGKKLKIRLMPEQGWRISGHMGMSPTILHRNNAHAPAGWI